MFMDYKKNTGLYKLCIKWCTFFNHPHDKTLLETTVLAPIPPSFINRTVFVGKADVLGVFLNSPLQKRASEWLLICNETQRQRGKKVVKHLSGPISVARFKMDSVSTSDPDLQPKAA